MSNHHKLSRRGFLKVLTGGVGALVVGIPLARATHAPIPPAFLGDTLFDLGSYVRIDADGNIIIAARDPDTGTGVATALPRIIADELDAEWSRVSVVLPGLGVKGTHGKPQWTYGHQLGGTGNSIPAAWEDLRQMGALARYLLLQAAAKRLGVPATQLSSQKGQIIAPNGQRISYGALATDAATIPQPKTPPLPKRADRYSLIGRSAGDINARSIVCGQTPYTLDHQTGDAAVAVLAHCPWRDGQLKRIDTSATLLVKGVLKVVQLNPDPKCQPGQTPIAPAVAVVADSLWTALEGRRRLKLVWQPGQSSRESSALLEQKAQRLVSHASARNKTPPTTRVRDDGNVDKVARHTAHRLDALYYQPWLAHATAETMCCIAHVDKHQARLIVPTQAPKRAWAVVQSLTGLPPEKIQIEVPRIGGGYGRRLDHDYVAEAVMLAKVIKRPLRLMWTRDDDLLHDWYRPASTHHLSAIIDQHHRVIAWDQKLASASALVGRGVPEDQLWTSEVDADQLPAGLVSNYRSDWYNLASTLPRGPHRAMPHLTNAFAVQSFIDELAHLLHKDPLRMQQQLLGNARHIPLRNGGVLDTGRLHRVLQRVAGRIGWKKYWRSSGNGLGIACWRIGDAYVAHAIKVAFQARTLRIERAVCAVDVGRVINPKGLENQVTGATLDALGCALNLAISFEAGQAQQHNWKDYPIARMAQLPRDVEVIVVPSDDRPPTGASFLAMPSAAPALANAVFRACAVRVRRLPLTKELLRML